jgi:hypothetical protein
MELKDFLNKVVVSVKTKKRYYLSDATAAFFRTVSVEPDENGHNPQYVWSTINGDPITNGDLVFEDPSLTVPFMEAYKAHCNSRAGYWEDYGYWMRKD